MGGIKTGEKMVRTQNFRLLAKTQPDWQFAKSHPKPCMHMPAPREWPLSMLTLFKLWFK